MGHTLSSYLHPEETKAAVENRSIWFGCMLVPIVDTLPAALGGRFHMLPFFLFALGGANRVPDRRMVLIDRLHGNQATPILITSAPYPRPPRRPAERPAGERFRQTERKWRRFQHSVEPSSE